MNDLVVGCLQLEVSPGAVAQSLKGAERGVADLARRGCRLVVLPEMWSCGFAYGKLKEMAEETPFVIDALREWSVRHGLTLVGSLPEAEDETVFNVAFVIDSDGEIKGRYRKIHLFTLHGEHHHFGRGTAPMTCSTSVGKLGIMICYDLRFPELARRLALDGAEILCVSALWPSTRVEHWSLLLRSRALENQLFVVGCNGCGYDNQIRYGGSSAVISPTGKVLIEAGDRGELISATLFPAEMAEFRSLIPCFQDRLPGAYGQF